MKKTFLWITLSMGLGFSLQAQTSETNGHLKKALERFPAADTNQDGVLTRAEAKEFQKQQGSRRVPGKSEPPEGGERIIYKKAGDVELPLYVFKPEEHTADAKAPAIVFFFGGGWKSGNPNQFEHHCKHLAKRGMVVSGRPRLVVSKVGGCES